MRDIIRVKKGLRKRGESGGLIPDSEGGRGDQAGEDLQGRGEVVGKSRKR